jgi:hypothetical protein
MSPLRIGLTVAICVALVGITGWQIQRERAVQACLATGKIWHGPTSTCEPARVGPILQRDQLKRTEGTSHDWTTAA